MGFLALDVATGSTKSTAVGSNALAFCTTGDEQVAVGYRACYDVTTGGRNSAVGVDALANVTSGTENTALGYQAGDVITTGSNNTCIGRGADASSATVSNEITLGNAFVTKFRIPGIGITFGDNTTFTDGHVLTYSSSTGEVTLAAASGGGGASAINDLSDAKTDNSGALLALGTGAAAADDGTNDGVAIGKDALNDQTTGTFNCAVGNEAFSLLTDGGQSAAFGVYAGRYATGGSNVFLGYSAGEGVSGSASANYCTAVGEKAMENFTSGDYNSAFGYRSLRNVTTGTHNISGGTQSSDAVTTGSYNASWGNLSLGALTTGSSNIAIGYRALTTLDTWSHSVAIGRDAGAERSHHNNSTFVGGESGKWVRGNRNTALGYQAMRAGGGTACSDNTAIGQGTLFNVDGGGNNNVAVGAGAGGDITTGSNNIVIGKDAEPTSGTVNNEITLGNGSHNKLRIPGIGITFGDNTTLTDGHVLTYSSSTGEVTLAAASGGGSIGINTDAQNNHYGIDQNGQSFSGTDAANNTLFGHQAGFNITTGDKNVVIGSLAGDALTTGIENVAVGYQAGSGETTQTGDTAVGAYALSSNTGQYNVGVGYRAGTSVGSSGNFEICIGYWAGAYMSGDNNISMGNFSMGSRTTTGALNIAIGQVAGYDLGGGERNTMVGSGAGYAVIGGDYNTFIGERSGYHFDNDASSNIAIGRRAGYNVDGNNNTIIGSMEYPDSTTMNGQVAIGAGTTELVRINDTGLGIGTNGPSAKLQIFGGSANDHGDGILLSKQGGNIYGIYPSTNNLEFKSVTGNTHIATFDYSGNIGIGTDNPASPLHIGQSTDNSVTAGITLKNNPSIGAQRFTLYNEEDVGTHYNSNDGGTGRAHIFETGGSEKLRITSDGKLGVKVTSPGCQTGGIHAVHDATEGTPTFTGGEVGIFQRNYNSAQGCEIGIIGGSNSSSRINFGDKDDADIGIISYSHNDNSMRFIASASERLRITSDGHGEFYGGAITRVLVEDDGATTSGTSKEFPTSGSIPSWATKITLLFDRVSTSGSSNILVQLGTSSGAITSNYDSSTANAAGSTLNTSTSGFVVYVNNSSSQLVGRMIIEKVGTTSSWIATHVMKHDNNTRDGAGVLTTYSGTIDRVYVTTVMGSNTFDGGAITVYAEA